jgi:uncharacterized protein YecE (DUF72 family)
MVKKSSTHGILRTGMGGWNFAPWRGVFYPEGLTQKRELEYASQHVTSIEINGTYYRAPSPEVYRQWAATVPDGFLFSVKAPRYIVQTKALATTGERVGRFLEGAVELGDRLGPVLWQFLPTRSFDPDDIARFLDQLPAKVGGVALRHAVEVRHESFLDPRWVELARERGVATVYTDSPDYPNLADLTGPFVYARLMRSEASRPTGYTARALGEWATRAAAWTGGGDPTDLPHVAAPQAKKTPKDAFVYFISAAKERNPAAAMALATAAGIA